MFISPNIVVDNSEFLFGRTGKKQELYNLRQSLLKGESCVLYGERRTGKTSVLSSLRNDLKNSDQRLVIFIKSDKLVKKINQNTQLFFVHLLSYYLVEIRQKNLSLNAVFQNVSVHVSDNLFDLLEYFEKYIQKAEAIFNDIVEFLYINYKVKTICMFDEYEILFLEVLSPRGFFGIRALTEKSIEGESIFSFVVAGAEKVETITTKIGSPELNTIGTNSFILKPLTFEYANQLIDHIYKYTTKNNSFSNEHIYELCGGIPYFIKSLISFLDEHEEDEISYVIFKDYFESWYKKLTEEEINCLFLILTQSPLDVTNEEILPEFYKRGFLLYRDREYFINGLLFEQFLNVKYKLHLENHNSSTDYKDIVDKIREMINKINHNSHLSNNKEIYQTTKNSDHYKLQIKEKCTNRDDFQNFINSLYLITHESTKPKSHNNERTYSLQTLPDKIFQRPNTTMKYIAAARHIFFHDTASDDWSGIQEVQVYKYYLGIKNPSNSDYEKMRIKILEEFYSYLLQVHGFLTT